MIPESRVTPGILGSLLAVPLLLALSACGTVTTESIIPDRRADYRASQSGNPLEVPPDLTRSTIDDTLVVPELTPLETANLSDYADERRPAQASANGLEPVLQAVPGVTVRRASGRRWLEVEQAPSELWPRVTSFWTDSGFLLERADPTIGIMETNWLENRADIPDGPIRNALKRFLDFAYAAPTRDKFRIRLEPSADTGSSEVYLTHYGVDEVNIGSNVNDNILQWQPRARDPELEAEMLNRLMVHLGAAEQRVKAELAKGEEPPAGPKTRFVDTEDGYRALVIEESYDRAWRLVGLALDGGNYAIEDQNRAEGLYLIGPASAITTDPTEGESWLADLAFWRSIGKSAADEVDLSDRYRVRLAGRGPQTLVVVQNDQGEPDRSPVAGQILDSVQQVIQ